MRSRGRTNMQKCTEGSLGEFLSIHQESNWIHAKTEEVVYDLSGEEDLHKTRIPYTECVQARNLSAALQRFPSSCLSSFLVIDVSIQIAEEANSFRYEKSPFPALKGIGLKTEMRCPRVS